MASRLPRPVQPLPLVSVPSGHPVLRQGEPCAGPWVLESGAVFVTAVSPDGRVLGIDVLGPGDLVGEPAGAPEEAGGRALRPCRLRPAIGPAVTGLAAERARRAAALARDLAWLDVGERVERRLTDLAGRFGRPVPGGWIVGLPLTQEDLAALAGTTRESTNRALRGLQRRGRVSLAARGRYVVHQGPRPVVT